MVFGTNFFMNLVKFQLPSIPNIDYGWDTEYPYRLDGVITFDQVGLDLSTLSQTDIDCVTIDRTLSIIALSTGQRIQMYKTNAPSSPQQLRLENFYNGSYTHPDASANSYTFVNNGSLAGSNITMITFSPANYLWAVAQYTDTVMRVTIAGNVNSASEFSSFSPVTSTDFGSGTSVSIQFTGGYVYIARQSVSGGTWFVERWDFTEPTPAQYESLTANFNPETLGYFSNKQVSGNLKGITTATEQLHGIYVLNRGRTLMVVVRGGGHVYFYDLSSNPYDITTATITSSTSYLTPSSSQYYWDPNATIFPMTRAVGYANDVGQITVIEESNGDTPMFLIDSKSTGTNRDQQFFLGLIRAERPGDPDPLTTIHLDFDGINTYRVNTLYPSSVTYTQNTQYAIVGSACAYLDGTAGIEIQHDPQDGTNNYEEIYSFKHSFSGWFRFTSLSGTIPLLGTDYSDHPRLLYNSSSNYISAHTRATASNFEMRWNYTFSTDTWYHVCYALQPSNVEGMILWINGTKITRTYVDTAITGLNENNRVNYEPIMAYPGDTTLKNQFIGRYVNTYMTGYVDDIRYYIGRIPDSYVQTLYNIPNITISSFTYTHESITITKSDSGSKNWSWSLNGVEQGLVLGTSGTTQTITGLTLQNEDVVVVTMSESSVTETLSGIPLLSQHNVYNDFVGAFSTRRLFYEYSGPQIRIAKSSDGTEADIYFDSNGNITEIENSSETVLNTWLNGAIAKIKKWYDQSGNTNHVQPSENSPELVYETTGPFAGLYGVYFGSSENRQLYLSDFGDFRTVGAQPHTIFSNYRQFTAGVANQQNLFRIGTPTTNKNIAFHPNNGNYYFFGNDIFYGQINEGTVTFRYAGGSANSTNKKFYLDGTEIIRTGSSTSSLNLDANPVLEIGHYSVRGTNYRFNGYVFDMIFANSDLGVNLVSNISRSLATPTIITDFTYENDSITITKNNNFITDWSWSLNTVNQGTVTGVYDTTQTITGLTLKNGDVITANMSDNSLTKTVSGLTIITNFTYSSGGDSITITKSDTDPEEWTWSLNTVSQGTITGASGTTQTITSLSLANGDIVSVTMSSNTLTQTISGIVLPDGVNTYTLTDDFSSGGASKITYQLNGISDNEAYSVSVSPNGSYTHDHTLNNLQRGKYTIVFSVADHDNQGSNASYGHYGWVNMRLKDSSGTNMTNYLANNVLTNATSGTNDRSTSSYLYGQFDGSQQNNKQFVITADLEIPETADYKISVFVVSSDNSGTSASAKYNVEIKPPPPKTISVSFDYNIGGATLTHNNPNDVYVYLYDDDTDTLYANPLISWGQSSGDNTWKSYSNTAAVFSGTSCRLVFKLVDGPHVHDTGWADVTIGNTTFTFGANDEQNFLWQNFNSTTLNLNSAVNVNTTSTINSRNAATSNGSAVLIQARSGGAYFLYYEGSGNSSENSSGTAWLITPAVSV